MALKIEWSLEAKADVRALDKTTAMFVFDGLLRYVRTGNGDVKSLHGSMQSRLRLRVGDYRVIFRPIAGTILINAVRHRREVYRG